MPRLTWRDRYEILAMNPQFRRALMRLDELRRKPPSIKEIFSENPRIRQKANQDQQERQVIEEHMRGVGFPSPPSPTKFSEELKQDDGSPVKPHMRFIRISHEALRAKREDGKDFLDRKSISKREYDLTTNQILTIDIDILAAKPYRLSRLVHEHIKKAREQLCFFRERSPLHDDWWVWKEHRQRRRSLTEIAREMTGITTEDARKNNTLNACIMSVQRSVKRIDKKIKLLPYPPEVPRYISRVR